MAAKVSVGNVEITLVSDGIGRIPVANLFPKVSAAEWQKYPEEVSSDGTVATNFGAFILRSQGRTILVDTGVGGGPEFGDHLREHGGELDNGGILLEELRSDGVNLDDVDIVACTHIHPDHVGWNLTQIGEGAQLTFPNAKYWVPKGDWDHLRQPPALEHEAFIKVFKDLVLPLEGLGALELIDGETRITDEVTMVPTPGHTPGHMSIDIASQGKRGFITGDVVDHAFQAQETAWEPRFDRDPVQARRTREAVLERLERENILVGAHHFMPPNFGRFVRTEGRRYWQGL